MKTTISIFGTLFRRIDVPVSAGGMPALKPFATFLAYAIFFLYFLSYSLNSLFDPLIADESQWIYVSQRYFNLILRRDFHNPDWANNYWHFGKFNPKLAQYLMGFSLGIGGELDTRFDAFGFKWDQSMQWNNLHDKTPPWRTLFFGRLPMPFLAAACGALVLFLLTRCLGLVPAMLAGLFFGAHPQWINLSGRALQDIPAIFFALVFLAVLAVTGRRGLWQKPLTRAGLCMLALGFALGLAVGTKMSNLALLPVLATYLTYTALADGGLSRLFSARFWLLAGLALAAAGACFVLSNPYLYPGPLSAPFTGTMDLLRLSKILSASPNVPAGQILSGPLSKIGALNYLLIFSYLYLRLPSLARFLHIGQFTIIHPLAAAGAVYALAFMGQARKEKISAALDNAVLLMLAAGLIFAANFYWVPFRWTRFFLPFLLPINIMVGFGIEGALRLTTTLFRRAGAQFKVFEK